ncbi:MAG: chemotaxis protein CheW [Rhizobiales bacterium]|nr:chemotaxis protein CheW [Hyphomicrobiales bacterium]
MTALPRAAPAAESVAEFVTATIGGQLFGLPIVHVHDVFVVAQITPVPRAPQAVAGVLNLRGRIVTAIDMRVRLGMPHDPGSRPRLAVGVDRGTDCYGLLVDQVGEVVRLEAGAREPHPINIDPILAVFSNGIHRLEGRLLVTLDVERVLDVGSEVVVAS